MLISSSPPSATAADVGVDVTLSNFKTAVIEASRDSVVLAVFWAVWDPSCKQLIGVLEKMARASAGAVRVAKIDIDRNQPIAQQMGVQSVPSVYAIYKGRPVDGFAGAMTEAQIQPWLDKLLAAAGFGNEEKAGLDKAFEQAAELLASGDIATAQAIYFDIQSMHPENAMAYAGLVRCFTQAGRLFEARQMLEAASPEMRKDKCFESVVAALDLAEQAEKKADGMAELEAALEKNPADLQTRYDLAMACYAVGKREDAVDHLLEIVKKSRNWNDDAARKQLVKFFEAFGATDPLTLSARRRLSSLLFS